jgi:tRNA pseudouridine55 synthase
MTAQNILDGAVILIDKPVTWTSFNVVKKVSLLLKKRYQLSSLKVGHAGTLDPLATGLLILCTGKKTKEIATLQECDKEYVAVIEFGKTTPSYDLETEYNGEFPISHITKELIEEKLKSFIGEIDQVPPLYSAKYVDGRRAYKIARKGIEMELKSNRVNIKELEILDFNSPVLTIRISCSKGTYIRSFANDIGLALNIGAHLKALKRTISGNYSIKDALSIDEFQEKLFSLQPEN